MTLWREKRVSPRRWLVLPVVLGAGAITALVWCQHGSWSLTRHAFAQDLSDSAPVGVAPDLADVPPAEGNAPGARPFREPPKLLSEAEVLSGLVARQRALQERFEAHEDRRSQQPLEEYSVPEPPDELNVPPRPDAPGGELDIGGME